MENKLQELTQKIYTEGVAKANDEAKAIIEKAQKEANDLLKNTQKEASEILNKAKQESETLKKNTESELSMSVKQAVNAFKQELTSVIATKATAPVNEAISESNFIKNIIETVVKNWNTDASLDISLLLPEANKKELEAHFETKLKSLLDNGLDIQFTNQVKAGFKIGQKDGSYVISFTDDDFNNFFKAYARPKLRELLYGDK